jgi:hypothetical protein
MNTRALRNGVMLAIAAISASFEAPQLAQQSLGAATASLVDGPSSIAGALEQVASTVTRGHLGFDTNVYPGDKAMRAWKQSGEYEWVGYYLQAPCHKDGSWSGTRSRLVGDGWGLAVVYVGQQTWGQTGRAAPTPARRAKATSRKSHNARRGPRTRAMVRKSTKPVATTGAGCSTAFVNAAQGDIDARDAIARAEGEGFSNGTVIFLDVEHMDVIPQGMRDYYRAWTRGVLADGRYRPGVYTHTKNAAAIYEDVSDVYDQAGVDADPPFWVAGASGFSSASAPTDVGHSFASAWQGVLDVVRTHNGVRLPIDISVASVASPSLAAVQ